MILVSCAKKTIGESIERVERRKTSELMDVLDSLSVLKPNTFYSKISTKYADTSQNISFKTSIRLISDSAINALITYATLPIYNSILTSDSLKISNKRAKCFTKTKLNFIKENFGISFDYKNVEELILGMPIAYDASQKYFQIYDPYQYIISSHRKREIKKSDKKEKYQDDVIIKYFISNDLKNLKKIEVESKADTARVELFFLEREFISNINIPSRILIKIRTKRNEININMNYEKTEINFPQKLFFVIPEGYKECGD
jgi:hypothetical protein